jgi:cytochrome c-type biogenesis protein CcmF
VRDAGALLLIFTSLFALYVNIKIGAGVARADWRSLGGKIAHAGIALLLIGVIVTGRFSSKEHVSLPQYSPRTVLGRSMTYTGYRQLPDGKIVFNISVVSPGESFRLSPGMSPGSDQGVLRTPDIASFLLHDIYVSPIGVETANASGASTNAVAGPESLVIDASVKPGINLLWGGTLVMMAGFLLAFLKRSKES